MRYHVTVISPRPNLRRPCSTFSSWLLKVSPSLVAGGQLRRPFISVLFASVYFVQNEGSVSLPGAVARYIFFAPRCANCQPILSISMRFLHRGGFQGRE